MGYAFVRRITEKNRNGGKVRDPPKSRKGSEERKKPVNFVV